MNSKTRIGLVLVGFTIWITATLLFREIGSYFFERSVSEYWFNAISTGILYAGLSCGLMKWWRIPQQDWLQGAICIALPGMVGEIPILYGFHQFMSNMQPETAAKYGAFLFGGYVSLIGFAWLMSSRANSSVIADKQPSIPNIK